MYVILYSTLDAQNTDSIDLRCISKYSEVLQIRPSGLKSGLQKMRNAKLVNIYKSCLKLLPVNIVGEARIESGSPCQHSIALNHKTIIVLPGILSRSSNSATNEAGHGDSNIGHKSHALTNWGGREERVPECRKWGSGCNSQE